MSKIKPVIIISPGRAGSTMLLNAIKEHSQINHKGTVEPLAESCQYYSYYHDFIRNELNIKPEKLKLYSGDDMVTEHYKQLACEKYLNHVLENEDVIKLLYGHIMTKEVEDFIQNYDCSIVHLCRKNITSRVFSAFYNRWTSTEFKKNYKPISDKRFIGLFYKILAQEHYIDSVFNKKLVKVFYEDLLEDWDYWIGLVQSWCNLTHEDIKRPQNPYTRPKFSEFFENFDIPERISKKFPKFIWEKID